jgi:phosphatidylglycerol:prolipoprotein diacylglycerol transferase
VFPRLIETPYFTLYTFGALLALAYGAALWWVVRSARREGLDPDRVLSLCFWAIGGAIVGAKALLVLRNLSDYLADPSALFSSGLLASAGDFYGGFLGALAAVAIFFYRNRDMPVWRLSDLCGPAIALGQGIGRIGCFMAGDDYGSRTDVPWAVTFTHPDAAAIGGAPLGVPLHPVQLYESAFCFALFGFLVWLSGRKRFDGQVILAYAAIYAAGRFVIEYFRGDVDRGFVSVFSTSQFIAIGVFVVAVALYFVRSSRGKIHKDEQDLPDLSGSSS